MNESREMLQSDADVKAVSNDVTKKNRLKTVKLNFSSHVAFGVNVIISSSLWFVSRILSDL